MKITVPIGYRLIPEDLYQKVFRKLDAEDWQNIEVPTIEDVSRYAGVSREKIKKDLAKADCPLRVLEKGQKGKGKMTTFFKVSAEHYKKWLERK